MKAPTSVDRLARLSAWYDRHGPGAYVLAVRILGDRDAGATVVLATFLGLEGTLASLDDGDAERRLIYREVTVRALRLLREGTPDTRESTEPARSGIDVAASVG